MRRVQAVVVALSSVAVLSCSTAAPVKVAAGETCFRCRRSIVDVRVAAETISGDRSRFVSKFRGPGCLAKYLSGHPDEAGVIYVTDYASGRMIRPAGAFFVAELVDRNTGETDYRAYDEENNALAAAAERGTMPVSWDAVLAKAR